MWTPRIHSSLLLLSLLVALGLGYGCGPKSTQVPSENPAGVEIPSVDRNDSERIAELGSLRCPYAEECSASVGMLLVPKDESVGLCTAFLIGPDLAVTNSRCIPAQLRISGASCAGSLTMIFPEMELYPAERAGCSTVVSASEQPSGGEGGLALDYAVLRLSRALARPALPISSAGFGDGARIDVYRVNPIQGSLAQGELRKTSCRSTQNSLILPVFDRDDVPVALLADCEIVQGNSGSPAVAEDGTVRGVIQTHLDNESSALTERSFEPRAPFSFVTSFSCARISPDQGIPDTVSLPLVCDRDYSETALRRARWKRIEESAPSALSATQTYLDSWYAATSGNALKLRWEPISAENGINPSASTRREHMLVTAAPRCFRSPDAWLDKHKFLWFYKKKAELNAHIPVWRVVFGMDRYRHLSTRVLYDADRSISVEFNPSELKEKRWSKARISWQHNSGAKELLFEGVLSACP